MKAATTCAFLLGNSAAFFGFELHAVFHQRWVLSMTPHRWALTGTKSPKFLMRAWTPPEPRSQLKSKNSFFGIGVCIMISSSIDG